MLKSYLTTAPFAKFILIEDTVQEKGKPIFEFLWRVHLERLQGKLHYFVFHDNYVRVKNSFEGRNNVVIHNFTCNVDRWYEESNQESFEAVVTRLNTNDIVFVDSLAHTVYQYGLAESYNTFNILKNQTGVQQIIALLHLDLLEEKFKVNQLFHYLCTISISLQPKLNSNQGMLQYTYKKLGGKFIKQVEQYHFEGENLVTQKIEKSDPKKLIETSMTVEVDPEKLSTFKIGLSNTERKSRDQLVLPYLPQKEDISEGGKIIYHFDDVDDWDEEDPDDDLDI